MWRLVVVTSMLLTLAFGAVADAKCAVCMESVGVEQDGAGTTLRFSARAMGGTPLPETGTAVVMQFDGNRGKCLTVSLVRTEMNGNVGTFVGRFNFIYSGAKTLSGRADLGGSIWDFSVPLDGSPGTFGMGSHQGSIIGAGAPAIPAPVVITPDPATRDPRLAATAAPLTQPAPQSATTAGAFDGLAAAPVAGLGLVVIIVAVVSAYFDRKRSLSRATAG